MKVFPRSRSQWMRLAILALFPFVFLAGFIGCMTSMPGSSFRGSLPIATDEEALVAKRLEEHVRKLAGEIGERNLWTRARLELASAYIEKCFEAFGLAPRREAFASPNGEAWNLVAQIQGTRRPEEIVILGAHFDSVEGCPAADDNASGVAFLLELAREFGRKPQSRSLRFVAFGNEEPPYFQREGMGSREHARGCKSRGERVLAMISLETMGYYSDAAGSQRYPQPFAAFYPDRGDFLAFVGNFSSRSLVRRAIRVFREGCVFPSEGVAAPGMIPGIGWSDHWSFWEEGYPAIMLTDTAPFRNPHYHRATDLPDTLDYVRMGKIFPGLVRVVIDLCEES